MFLAVLREAHVAAESSRPDAVGAEAAAGTGEKVRVVASAETLIRGVASGGDDACTEDCANTSAGSITAPGVDALAGVIAAPTASTKRFAAMPTEAIKPRCCGAFRDVVGGVVARSRAEASRPSSRAGFRAPVEAWVGRRKAVENMLRSEGRGGATHRMIWHRIV